MTTDELIREISRTIVGSRRGAPTLVAFDGVDTSGKTTLANGVHECLKKGGTDSIRVSIDRFHNERRIRTARGEYSPEGFFYDSFNYAKMIELVLEPVKNGKPSIVDGIYDYRTESGVGAREIRVTKESVVLFDGIFLNRDELRAYWDISIFLDVSFDTVRRRAVERDAALFGSTEETLKKYNERYIPGEELYLASCDPRARADIIVDNNDWRNPAITKGWRKIL